jgi:hypothetical protein
MKYIEELLPGDCFEFKNNKFLMTHDFKNNGNRLCYSLVDGKNIWLESNTMVEILDIYSLDENNNIYPIKTRPKNT